MLDRKGPRVAVHQENVINYMIKEVTTTIQYTDFLPNTKLIK